MKHFTRTWFAVVVLLQLHLSLLVRGDFTTLQFGAGTPGHLQSVAQSNSFTLQSRGQSIGGASDVCTYHYMTNTGIFGNLDFSFCVDGINPVLAGETVAVMLRDGLADSARMFLVGLTVNAGGTKATLRVIQRSTNGQPATEIPPPPGLSTELSLPSCFRIVRTGNLISALISKNGTNWQSHSRIDTSTWRGGALPERVFIGITGVSSPAAATPPTVSLSKVNPGAPHAPYVTPLPDLVVDEDSPNPSIQFTVGDFESVFSVDVSAFSDNPNLFPSNRLTVFGAGAGLGLFVRPTPNGNGEANVTLVVSDGVRTAQDTFHVTVNPIEDPPVLSDFPDVTIDEDTDSGPISFTISDVDTPLDKIKLEVENNIPNLVLPSGYIFGGSGSNRTLTITPNKNAFGGPFGIVVTASDPSNTVKRGFRLKVNSVNDLPSIVPPPDVSFVNNTNSGFLPVRISDLETVGGALKVFATSFNTNLISSSGITFGGNNTNRTIRLTPTSGATGTTVITVFVVDGDDGTNSGTFNVTVTAPGAPFGITRQPGSTNVTQGDPFTLEVAATSGNPITYQWRLNGTNLPSQTAAKLTVPHAQAANAGRYDVVVTSAGNHVTSQPADVTVTGAPVAGTHDFGDAPDSYRTTLASNGARHLTVALQTGGQFVGLGLLVDLETNGVASAGSDGDDLAAAVAAKDDEDAIRYLTALVPGQTSRVEVVVRGNFEFPFLNVWIDFDRDGTFAQAGNRIFNGRIVSYGTNVLSFVVPANATAGLTHSRFRLTGANSTNSPLRSIDYFGEASNGEVEDHPVTIGSTVSTGPGTHDFGDAPNSYRTTLASNGARHVTDALKTNSAYVTLGNRVDLESDGAAGIGATGDDLNDTDPNVPANADDEDGIRFTTPIIPGQTSRVEVVVRGFSFEFPFLNAWIDFDFDGTFSPVTDKIFNGRVLNFGTNNLSFVVPANAKPTNTYARFRLTAANSTNVPIRIIDYFGEASVGEVEDYPVTIEQPRPVKLDFGDAPEISGQYPTHLASDGARHTIVQGFHLGRRVDAEADGQPEASATGDDKSGGADDEDGIHFIGDLQPGKLASVEVTASADGMLDAWIDFNQNSIWRNGDERIFTSIPLTAGVQTLSFNVPSDAKVGRTFARFRYSSAGGLEPTGPASDGEVEDYAVDITVAEKCDLSCAGTDFWLTFPGNYAPDPANPVVPVLRIVGSAGTTVDVRMPGLSSNINTTLVGSIATITLPAGVDLGNLNDAAINRGVHVTASQPIVLHALSKVEYTSDGYTAFPTEVTGTEYIVAAYPNVHVGIPEINGSQFAIVASSDNTTVTITPSIETGLRIGGVPYTVVLAHAGDCYQLRNTNDAPADLTGTIITSDHPVAVFSGHQCANINSRSLFYCDYLVEQMPPVNRWAAEFFTAPLATRLNGDTFRILASRDDTSVTIDTNTVRLANRGDVFEINLEKPTHILADKAVYVAQFANSSDFDGVTNADPFMVIVPGRSHFSISHSFATPGPAFSSYYIGVVAPVSVTQINLDGVVVLPAFTDVGTSGYHSGTVSITQGAHTLTATQPVGVTVYGWDPYVSFAWSSCLSFGDTTPPVLHCSTNRIFATVNPLSDSCDVPVPNLVAGLTYTDNCGFLAATDVVQEPSSASKVGVGTNRITLSVTDAAGNIGYCYVDFIVLDGRINGEYSLQCPKDRTVNCQGTNGAIVKYKVVGLRGCTPVPVECDPPSGSLFPRGTTKVTCRLPRPGLAPLECSFNVTVECRKRVGIQVKPPQTPGAPLEFAVDFDDQASVLEVANTPAGPWIRVPEARTGYVIKIAQEKGKFYHTVESMRPVNPIYGR